jgi:hypothetical protein
MSNYKKLRYMKWEAMSKSVVGLLKLHGPEGARQCEGVLRQHRIAVDQEYEAI